MMFLNLLIRAIGQETEEIRRYTDWMNRHPHATMNQQARMYTTMTNIWMRRMATEEEEQ